ncbi:mRNA-capping enzyme subunit beta [Porphyridium purpureum]|uniref:mRNA 5'-phosphatase n=1 Tax=Porphyridium purpureum TaxID=35688 RepID=A0A5J4Z072_PORPP|nr:mRNA-capping enzyme subunit beta [Porphyridium purpureum]|eukprot:POR5498..scf208_2
MFGSGSGASRMNRGNGSEHLPDAAQQPRAQGRAGMFDPSRTPTGARAGGSDVNARTEEAMVISAPVDLVREQSVRCAAGEVPEQLTPPASPANPFAMNMNPLTMSGSMPVSAPFRMEPIVPMNYQQQLLQQQQMHAQAPVQPAPSPMQMQMQVQMQHMHPQHYYPQMQSPPPPLLPHAQHAQHHFASPHATSEHAYDESLSEQRPDRVSNDAAAGPQAVSSRDMREQAPGVMQMGSISGAQQQAPSRSRIIKTQQSLSSALADEATSQQKKAKSLKAKKEVKRSDDLQEQDQQAEQDQDEKASVKKLKQETPGSEQNLQEHERLRREEGLSQKLHKQDMQWQQQLEEKKRLVQKPLQPSRKQQEGLLTSDTQTEAQALVQAYTQPQRDSGVAPNPKTVSDPDAAIVAQYQGHEPQYTSPATQQPSSWELRTPFNEKSIAFDDRAMLLAEFMAEYVKSPNVELEIKLGMLFPTDVRPNAQPARFDPPVFCETVLNQHALVRFESSLEQDAFRRINEYLNKQVERLRNHPDENCRIHYQRRHESVVMCPNRVRVLREKKKLPNGTYEFKILGAQRKEKLMHLNFSSPKHKYDFRVSASSEEVTSVPEGKLEKLAELIRDRHRVSYKYYNFSLDITAVSALEINRQTGMRQELPNTYEVEVEILPGARLFEACNEFRSGQTDRLYNLAFNLLHVVRTTLDFLSLAGEP